MSSLLTSELRAEYNSLFKSCIITRIHKPQIAEVATTMKINKRRYDSVASQTGVPWFVIGVIHNLEASFNFNTHLHNGDSLARKTVHVPAGRPLGEPPFTWEESAIDALKLRRLHEWHDWTISGTLFSIERYNGWGYHKRGVPSPYLWSFSNHYQKGKYVADGRFDPEAVSKQAGAVTILHLLQWVGDIKLHE